MVEILHALSCQCLFPIFVTRSLRLLLPYLNLGSANCFMLSLYLSKLYLKTSFNIFSSPVTPGPWQSENVTGCLCKCHRLFYHSYRLGNRNDSKRPPASYLHGTAYRDMLLLSQIRDNAEHPCVLKWPIEQQKNIASPAPKKRKKKKLWEEEWKARDLSHPQKHAFKLNVQYSPSQFYLSISFYKHPQNKRCINIMCEQWARK